MQRGGHSRQQRTSADSDHDIGHIVDVLEQFQGDRAVPGDDAQIVAVVEQQRVPCRYDLGRGAERLFHGLDEHHVGAHATDIPRSCRWSRLWKDDRAGSADRSCDVRHGPTEVAAADRDERPGPVGIVQRRRFPCDTAVLEGSAGLKVLQLQHDPAAEQARQGGTVHDRCAQHNRLKLPRRRANLRERNHRRTVLDQRSIPVP